MHSFKGWESPALVMGVGNAHGSPRLAYVSMTRLRARRGLPSYISVVNCDMTIAPFQSLFADWQPLEIAEWAPPVGARVRL